MRNSGTKALFTAEPNSDERSCYDCIHCIGYITWWCMNYEAKEFYNSLLPDKQNCRFWEPGLMEKDVGFFNKLFGNFILIDNSHD